MLGLQRGTVQVIPYTPLWASLFQAERIRLATALGSLALDIQHIGSTSIPGLAAAESPVRPRNTPRTQPTSLAGGPPPEPQQR